MNAKHALPETDVTTLIETLQDVSVDNKYILESRFGRIMIDMDNAIYFPSGLLGMPDKLHFCLADFPGNTPTEFKILQSLNDIELSFAVLPIAVDNPLIDGEDIEALAKTMETGLDDIGIVLIASTHNVPEGKQISVNLRAPIIINTNEQAAAQYVFPHTKYSIRHILTKQVKEKTDAR